MKEVKWSTPEGFNELVDSYKGISQRKAFQKANTEFHDFYGRSKYSSYESFWQQRRRLIKKGRI